MCVILGKYFEGIGWVGVKNRDRNYIPTLAFKNKSLGNDLEIMYYEDADTKYCEGINSNGVSILSASLMVQDDEMEIKSRIKVGTANSGTKIKHGLSQSNAKDAVKALIDKKLTGNTLVFDQENMYLLEGAWRPGEYKTKGYAYEVKNIHHDQVIARSNHGILLQWSGYQHTGDTMQDLKRISSESRLLVAKFVVKQSQEPDEMIDGLTMKFSDNPQLNAFRTGTQSTKMRTTAQIMLIPSEKTMYIRPVQSIIKFDFWKLNRPNQKTWVEIMSNRAAYQHFIDYSTGSTSQDVFKNLPNKSK
jgi:hypothetical protein